MFVSLVQIRPVIFVTVRSIWTCWKVKQVASRCAQVYWRVLELQFWNNRIKVFGAIYESQRILLICGILGVFNMRPPLREDRGWKNTLSPKEGNAWRHAQVQTTWLSPRNKNVQRMSERRTPPRIHHGESPLLSRTGNLLQTHIIVPGNELSSQNWSRHILTSRLTQLRPPRPLSRWLINSLKKRCRKFHPHPSEMDQNFGLNVSLDLQRQGVSAVISVVAKEPSLTASTRAYSTSWSILQMLLRPNENYDFKSKSTLAILADAPRSHRCHWIFL